MIIFNVLYLCTRKEANDAPFNELMRVTRVHYAFYGRSYYYYYGRSRRRNFWALYGLGSRNVLCYHFHDHHSDPHIALLPLQVDDDCASLRGCNQGKVR